MTQHEIDKLLQNSLVHHQAGRLADASAGYRAILTDSPEHVDATRLLGVIARNEGRIQEAINLLTQARDLDPARAETWHNLGDAQKQIGDLASAGKSFSEAARLRPDWAEAHGALGNILHAQGKLDHAKVAFERAIALKPALPQGQLNLGRVLHAQNRLEEAIASFKRAIQLRPSWAEAFNHLGNVLWDQQKMGEALAAYATADSLHPGHMPANWSAGKILLLQNQADDAIARFQLVTRHHPENAQAHAYLARALAQVGKTELACESYRTALRLKPDSPNWRFKLASLSGDHSVSSAPPGYVKDLFDEYAPTFDRELVDALKYQGPQRLLESLQAVSDRTDFDALDLGCGTGLCGQVFRPICQRLEGVDLSPEMIKRAEALKVYDVLRTNDVVSELRDKKESYDLLIAGDVLIYVGDLSSLMPAASRALRPGGLFVLTIENHDGEGFFLHSESRFAHSPKYVREQAQYAGLKEISATPLVVRKQAGADVPGWVFLLSRES